MALNKKNRLKKRLDFESVFKKGKAVKGSFLFIKYKENDLGMPRLGFVVSAKIAGKAVERNKIKRILSEAAKGIIKSLGNQDLVVSVTQKTDSVGKNSLAEDFLGVLRKIQ